MTSPLTKPVNAHNGTRRQRSLARVKTPPRSLCLELKHPAPEYNPNSERLLQLPIDKRLSEPRLEANSLGLPAWRAGVVSW